MKIIVLAGGGGTRLWPLSTAENPKQFIDITGDGNSLLIMTIRRFLPLVPAGDIIVVTGVRYTHAVGRELAAAGLAAVRVLVEPEPRNTAPAILLAAAYCRDELGCGDREVMVFAPADHVITNGEVFISRLAVAARHAAGGGIVLLAIKPDRPETGFGYLKIEQVTGSGVSPVSRFVEKPGRAVAGEYLADGRYFWNSGIFCFSRAGLEEQLGKAGGDWPALAGLPLAELRARFGGLPDISFDYAVMEKADRVSAVILPACWSDIGSWAAVYDIAAKDGCGNVIRGDVLALDCQNSLFFAQTKKMVGVELTDTMVIEHNDVVMVMPRGAAQRVREVQARIGGQESTGRTGE
ncbi:MAG: sugar phosphate nucleotidyltransferase [Negativicutes bacterium]|nr:sugar phosphate nucleotidyltransferase [Negativicutes bacterium]